MIISFYTPDYEEDALNLQSSARKFNHDIELIPVTDQGSWELNCGLKAKIALEALERYQQILFLDADAELRKPIDKLLEKHSGIKLDIAQPDRFRSGWFAQRYRYHAMRNGGMWNSGIMSIRRSKSTIALMKAWIDKCEQSPQEWDQVCLQRAHIETKSNVKVEALPPQFWAGREYIAHRSGFHRIRKKPGQTPIRKVLLLGSADYLPDWWEENAEEYKRLGFDIVCMNNSIGVVGDDATLWLIPNDYSGEHVASEKVPSNKDGLEGGTNKERNWFTHPYWLGPVKTIMLSCLYHLINEALRDGVKLTVHLAGCDMIYNARNTHFYGNSTQDPLRYNEVHLKQAMRRIDDVYALHGGKIFNVGCQKNTRLTFARL